MKKRCDECNSCKMRDDMTTVMMSSADWQRSEQRHLRREKRFVALIVLLVILLVGTNIGWMIYESQFETTETIEEYAVEQDGSFNNSIINGGEIVNGETEDNLQENN